jgi:hypothetical protein
MRSCCHRTRLGLPVLLLFSSCLAVSQSVTNDPVHDVEVCQLLQNPETFDGQIVRFRGHLQFEFEGHRVDDTSCHLPLLHRGIWWSYGGEYWVANQSEKKRIESLTSPTVKDAQFDEFRTRTTEHRRSRPDGRECTSRRECAYYDVMATFVGRFFAGRWTWSKGNIRSGGFGHMGCCHLFVIEQISDVVAKRTAVPDDAMTYTCSSTEWQSDYPRKVTSILDERAEQNREFLAEQMRTHDDTELADSMDIGPSWHYIGFTGSVTYSSPDLLTSYTLQFAPLPKRKRPANDTAPMRVTITSERCILTTLSN